MFLTRVDAPVSCQMDILGKAAIAYLAYKRFLTSVDALMRQQIIIQRKALITFITLIRFLTCVDTPVFYQIVFLYKTLITINTFISSWPYGITYFWLLGQVLCKAQRREHSRSYVTGVVTKPSA